MLIIISVVIVCSKIRSVNIVINQFMCDSVRFLHRYTSESWPMAEELQNPQPSSDSAHRAHVSGLLVNNREKQINTKTTEKNKQINNKTTEKNKQINMQQ